MGNPTSNRAFEQNYTKYFYNSSLTWQIDVNVTSLQGAHLQILNGTSFFYAGSPVEISELDFKSGKRNFSFNSTFNVS